MISYAIHTGLPNLGHIFMQCLPFYALLFLILGATIGFDVWKESKTVIRRYAFRADLLIAKQPWTTYQGVHIIIPARSLEQATAIAEQMGNLNNTCPTYDPEFRHG